MPKHEIDPDHEIDQEHEIDHDVTVIAIDGPAAAGKGTLARRLAAHFGLRYLDSGQLYRAVAAKLLREGHQPDDAQMAVAAAQSLKADDLEVAGLRDEAVGQAASIMAPFAEVRAALLGYQRSFAGVPPGAVIDGRDIGSIVFPDAAYKFFVTASLEARVARRIAELAGKGEAPDAALVRDEMAARDARDAGRGVAPLTAAPDAHVLDTSELDADGAFSAALAVIGADK